MPRYYNLTLIDPSTGATAKRANGSSYIWTTNDPTTGAYDPGALDIQFDLPVYPYHEPMGAMPITIYGIGLADLQQSQNFAGTTPGAGMTAVLKAGMTAGLPLANAKQAGVIAQGTVIQSYGNWVGGEITLDLLIAGSSYTPARPGNIVLDCAAGAPLSTALQKTLSTAFPNFTINMQISAKLVWGYDVKHVASSLEDLASTIHDLTEDALYTGYDGVSIFIVGGAIYVQDGTVSGSTVNIAWTDLVGQPTWIGLNLMQIVLVMRADIQIGDTIKLPAGMTNAAGSISTAPSQTLTGLKTQTSFQGNFLVQQLRQIGNLRSSDGQGWVTVINCTPVAAASS